jgi:hypothetical protein
LLHHRLSFSRRAAFAIVRRVHRRRRRRPLPSTTFVFLESTQWLSAIGRMGAGGGGFDGTTRGAASAKKHGSSENAVWTAPPPINVERDIYEYVDRKNKDTFFTTNLL